MSTLTPNLNLFKIIPSEDAKKAFNFYEILNDNWDKLDSFSESIRQTVQEEIQTLSEAVYNTVYGIGQPFIRLNDYLAENEVRLEGAEVYIADYYKLYEIYGNTYGEARTGYFRLPDCRNRVFWGGTTAGYLSAGLPNIEGWCGTYSGINSWSGSGALYSNSHGGNAGSGSPQCGDLFFDASRSNSIYGNSTTVQPPSIKVRVVTRFK